MIFNAGQQYPPPKKVYTITIKAYYFNAIEPIRRFKMERLLNTRWVLPLLIGVGSGCGSRNNPEQKISFPDDVSFSVIRSSILEPKCSRCHLNLTSYDGAKEYFVPGSPDRSDLYSAVRNDSMPPNGTPLSTEEKSAIYRWIERGAEND